MQLRLERVSKHWGTAKAVDSVSFATESGKLVVLLGPSGCGKSTTLRMIAGLETPTRGARSSSTAATSPALPPAERGISMVFQSYALFPHLSVAREHRLRPARCGASRPRSTQRRLERVADLLGPRRSCWSASPRSSRAASSSASRSAARSSPRRQVCLMDEPLSNLDAQLRQEMRREIRALQQQLGMTMVYVTHDQTEAMSMADQVVLLRDGRIEQDAHAGRALRAAGDGVRRALHRHAADEHRRRARPAPTLRSCGIRPSTCASSPSRRHGARRRAERRVPRRRHRRHVLASAPAARRDARRAAARPLDAGRRRAPAPRLGRAGRPLLRATHRPPPRRRRSPFRLTNRTKETTHEETALTVAFAALLAAASSRCRAGAEGRPRSTSTTRSRSAARSRRRSTRWPPNSARRTPTSRSTRSTPAPTRTRIVKALTATKSGKPPQLAVLLSTDMFSLIDEDAIVPIDDIAKSADDKKWLDGFYKAS